MASNVKVSSNFTKSVAKKATAVEEARKAENTMQTCKMPVGWSGHAICSGARADKGKDRKDEKGQTQEGNDYVALDFEVINDEKYAGSKFSVVWTFYDSEKASWEDRFTWCLNGLENLGLPEEYRRGEDFDLAAALAFFADGDTIFAATVVHNEYRRGDQKEVKVTLTEAVSDSDSISPDSDNVPASSIEIGSTVKYMGKDWEVMDVDGDDLQVKSLKTGNVKQLTLSDLD